MSLNFLLKTPPGVLCMLLFFSCRNGDQKSIIISDTNSDTAVISSYLKKANAFIQTNFDSMHYYMDQARSMSTTANFKEGEAKARAIESNYLRFKGDYSGALAIGLEVLSQYDSLGLWKESIKLRNLIADIYKQMGGEKGTIDYLLKGIEIAKEAQAESERRKYTHGIVISLNQQGITLRDMSKETDRKDYMDSAFFMYDRAIKLVNSTGESEEELGKLYNNISQVYNEHYHEYHKALEYLQKAVDFNSARNNQNSLTYNYGNISTAYLNLNDPAKANTYAHMMRLISEQLKSPFRLVNAYNNLIRVNKKLGHYDSALYYKELSTNLSDSLNNVKKSEQIAESQTKYETGKKEAQITVLSNTNRLKNQRLALAFGLIALFGITVVVSIIQNRRLSKQKAQISGQSERLQWMMKELHHRVKNNLQIVSSLLNLQTYRLKDEESITAIKESQLRVQAMSLIHQRLYQVEDVSMVNFKLYLDDLVDTLMRAYGYGPDDFDLSIKIEKEFLDVDTVMPLGLLVNEIITNSFKYAYRDVKRPLLHINMTNGNQQLKLEIKDNGPGLQPAAESKAVPGFGKKLIDALSKQLKATYSVNSSGGTVYNFVIPDSEKAA